MGALAAVLPPGQAGAQTIVSVSIDSPGDGTVLRGTAGALRVAGRAQASAGGALQQYDVMIILDVSGSTSNPSGIPGAKGPTATILGAEVAGAERLVNRLDPRTTRVGVVTFSGDYDQWGRAVPGVPAATLELPLTTDLERAHVVLQNAFARGAHGGTDMSAGLRLAIREMAGLPGALGALRPGARRIALLLTDGFPTLPVGPVGPTANKPDVELAVNAARLAAKAGITIHTFAIGPEALSAPFATTEIARVTGGRFTPVARPEEVAEILPRTSLAGIERVELTNVTTGEVGQGVSVLADGGFGGVVPLGPGANRIRARAIAADGAEGLATITVTFEPPGHAARGAALEDRAKELEKLRERTKILEEELRDLTEKKRSLDIEIRREKDVKKP